MSKQANIPGLFFPFHRYFVWSYTQALKNDCGYTGVAPYWNWTIGKLPLIISTTHANKKDSANVKDGTIWSDDSSSGLGQATGIESNDFVVGTGGFSSNFTLAYPSTHGLRRNFTLQPYTAFAGSSFFSDATIDANATFTPEKINGLIANYTGDFKGFQKYMEGFEGPHGAVHEILGGDLGGYCPENANEACFANEPSPTYSANEPMFWIHHAVCISYWSSRNKAN